MHFPVILLFIPKLVLQIYKLTSALKITPSQDHTMKIAPLQDHAEKIAPNAPTPTTAVACNIISLRKAFPNSFDTTANMPVTYTIHTNPNIQPV